ncbi:hypothetical protein [Levilactobacillus brevis]|uniref:hypothetical protein n=1 Tax=Levilactobacillus brevis TaxID=1580 RepID=UPI0004ACB071|nr:hypothetical protein [Levilactobacillus brevis]
MNITQIIQLLSDTGILGIVIFLFVAWFNRINPAVKTKIGIQLNPPTSVKFLVYWTIWQAMRFICCRHLMKMPGDEKREKAVADVTSQLNGLGHDVDPAIISAAIEKAYQLDDHSRHCGPSETGSI